MGNDQTRDDKYREAVALFRYGLIAELTQVSQRGLYAKLRQKAALDYEIPGSLRRRVAVETLRGWLRGYRGGGFDALLPKPRCDSRRPPYIGCSRNTGSTSAHPAKPRAKIGATSPTRRRANCG
jgi:hypothetical protein